MTPEQIAAKRAAAMAMFNTQSTQSAKSKQREEEAAAAAAAAAALPNISEGDGDDDRHLELPPIELIPSMSLLELGQTLDDTSYYCISVPNSATVAAACQLQMSVLAQRPGVDQEACDLGALETAVLAMRAHNMDIAVQSSGCELISILLVGCQDDADEQQ